MTYLTKPKLHHPGLPTNVLGLTRRDYEGAVSTLCAGCGHDSISAAIIQAFFELAIPPHRVAKLSGIGCSSKTPTYFLSAGHGFNSVHGRMPSVVTGRGARQPRSIYLGVSGDGDSASIGLGQFAHIMRRGVNMDVHRREQWRLRPHQGPVLGDRGQGIERRSAARSTATSRSTSCSSRSCSARASSRAAFSGDKGQLVPLIKAAVEHKGIAFIDSRFAVRRVQQPPGLDQELRLRAGAQRSREPSRLHAAAGADRAEVPAGAVQKRRAARRRRAAAAQAARRLRRPRQGRGARLPRGAPCDG
jgi:2-oxoglutarate ferredoxin oxidoreductase subunit beta